MAGQYSLKYISWTTWTKSIWSSMQKMQILDPRFAESESLVMKPRMNSFLTYFLGNSELAGWSLGTIEPGKLIRTYGVAQGEMATGKCGLFKNMVRLSSFRGGRVLAICASFYEKHFFSSTVSSMSLLLIYKHSLNVREFDFCHRCVNYFLLKLYFFCNWEWLYFTYSRLL